MEFSQFTEKQCIFYLSERYGLTGFNRTGLTKKISDRTIDNLRKECEIQSKILND